MNAKESNRLRLMTAAFLVLAALACNAPVPAPPTKIPPTPTVSSVKEASPTLTSIPVLTDTPVATDTPVPDISGPGGCTLNAAYVADVTVPDDTEFAPGEAFTKVWRMRNSGTCDWEAGTQLISVSGEAMGGLAAVDVPPLAPDSSTDISVDMIAPPEPGTYRSNWQLRAPDGTRFGSVIYTQVIVPELVTKTPTPTATSTLLPPIATPTRTPAVPSPLAAAWEATGGEEGSLGCPIGEAAMGRWVADQQFERGYMYWRDNEGASANYIYVLYYLGGTNKAQGYWERYEDTWAEDMDELSCAEATLPNGPARGFGKVWCEHVTVRLAVGEATEPENGLHAEFQDFEGGTLLWTSRLHFIYALFSNGTWQRFDEVP